MAKSFSVTTDPPQVKLGDNNTVKVKFTVTNLSEGPRKGGFFIVPEGSAKAEWFSLAGQQERDFATSQQQDVMVDVAVPAGTSVGNFSFRLDAYNVDEPEEDVTEGPRVSFAVQEKTEPKPSKFPWWMVAAAVAGVVILGAGGYFIYDSLSGGDLKVPNFAGARVDTTADSLKNMGLVPRVAQEKRFTGKVQPGTVAATDPAADESVSKGDPVDIFVEADHVTMPNLNNARVSSALTKVFQNGLNVKNVKYKSVTNTNQHERVVDQNPKAGHKVAKGTDVVLTIGRQPQRVLTIDPKIFMKDLQKEYKIDRRFAPGLNERVVQ